MACPLAAERVWVEKSRYHDAEREHYERLAKLLKGTVSAPQIENIPFNVNLETNKKKQKKNYQKSQSPETMSDNMEIVIQKSTPITVSKAKKHKKAKPFEPESLPTESGTNNASAKKAQEVLSLTSETVEDTKAKKKKKKKSNKDINEKLQDISLKENVPPNNPSPENKIEIMDSKKDSKGHKNKGTVSNQCTLVSEIAKARQHIKNSLEKMDGIATLAASPASPDVLDRLAAIERDNADLRKLVESLKGVCLQSENRVKSLEQKLAAVNINVGSQTAKTVAEPAQCKVDDDDGVDLFASDSDEDDEEAAKIREERLAAYAAKKSKKPVLIAKSSLVLDVKPWDDETDMKALEAEVRKISSEGLLWGASKCVPVAYGINKLSISCVVEDDKVSIDWLTEEIEKIEDFVQSIDIAAFNKI